MHHHAVCSCVHGVNVAKVEGCLLASWGRDGYWVGLGCFVELDPRAGL